MWRIKLLTVDGHNDIGAVYYTGVTYTKDGEIYPVYNTVWDGPPIKLYKHASSAERAAEKASALDRYVVDWELQEVDE
jgi:hypothetical protein